jgi:hypothetical protein
MGSKSILARAGLTSAWSQEIALAAVALLVGFGLMPVLIFFTGSAVLGRYEDASVGRLFDSLYDGLFRGSLASWGVVLGPYVLYLLFKVLRFGWRVGRPA